MKQGVFMKHSFHDELISRRDQKHSKNHPFFNFWVEGKLTKEQTTHYCLQHYHYVSSYLDWMAYEASQVPYRDVKAYLFENLGDEERSEEHTSELQSQSNLVC